MPTIYSDAILHYAVEDFGRAGYAVPNWSTKVGSNNQQILDLVDLIGANVFTIMHHEDVHLATPPSVNTLQRIHKLYLRISHLLASRAVAPGTLNMEPEHVTPAGGIFRVYPCPYFLVRNPQLRRWCGYAFYALTEAMQHTENARTMEISTTFAGQIGQYFTRIYREMAVELLGKTNAIAEAPGFALKDEDFRLYDPTQYFTRTELVDSVHPLDLRFTEDRLVLLRQGINVTELPNVKPWPVTLQSYYAAMRGDGTLEGGQIGDSAKAGTQSSTVAAGIIPPPPAP